MENVISVIVVDDNASFVQLFCAFLHYQANFKVLGGTQDISHAFELIRQKQPDVVLLNVTMPEAAALRLISDVKSIKHEKQPEFFIMGAPGIESVMVHAYTLGIVYCMIKPFDFETAANRITALSRFNCRYFADAGCQNSNGNDDALENRINNILYSIGLTPNLQGFWFLKDSILIATKVESRQRKASAIYNLVASHYETTPSCVERSIQYAKKLAAQRGKQETELIFKRCSHMRNRALPTNIEFITAITRKIL